MNTIALGSTQLKQGEKSIFISPVRIPVQLSANFGELRPDHYHSGLDLKTQGVTGKDIVATADGYISRIGVSPGGFGRALYMTHPSGFTTVYGHLDRFSPEIEEYVKSEQYAKKSFTISLFPEKDRFRFRQGELIAYSGNSGSSGGPHLHYEIRRTDGERPVNPLFFEFGTGDNINPVVEKLVIYPLGKNSEINGRNAAMTLNVAGGHGNYYLPAGREISISGPAGFGIRAFDLLNDSYNKCAVYSIELEIDSVRLFRYVMDSFSFSETRYINSHIDYETYIKDNVFIERVFRLPNDRLSVYKEVINRGIFNFKDSLTHSVRIKIADVHNNVSVLAFMVKPAVHSGIKRLHSEYDKVMPYNRSNTFSSDGISFSIPAGSLYDTLFFTYARENAREGMFSDIHIVHNRYTPLHRPGKLILKPSSVPKGKESKLLIANIGDNNRRTAIGTSWNGSSLEANISTLGAYFVAIDTVAPEISASGFTPGTDLRGRKSIRFRITDDFSGIKSYEPEIDGKWYLFEYDPKNNLLICDFDEDRIRKGAKHDLVLKVNDNRDNSNTYRCSFTW
ncbi:MAG: M23 family metallopeptidase [Bacteroidales bacterium]|nr:M23 family metallopeptidase [Bacteroidales bacterium]